MEPQAIPTPAGRRRNSSRFLRLPRWVQLTGSGLVFLALFLLPDLVAPARAHALSLDIPNLIPEGFDFLDPTKLAGNAIEKAGSEAADAIKDAFFWMLNQIFGGMQATLSVKLLTWLTQLPDFSGGQVMKLQKSMQIAAGACLGAVLTLSIVRFWLGSYTSNGGVSAGVEGVIRTAIAALLIGLWPKIFAIGVGMTNGFTAVLLNDAARKRLEDLFQGLDMASLGLPAMAGAAGGAIGLFIGAGISILIWIIVSTAAALLFLALIVMKIVITAGTVIAFVAMPIALVLWPIPETSWVASMLAKALAVLLAIPVLWVLIFAAASAVGADVFFLSNNGKNNNFLQTGMNILLIKPLVACALLYLAVTLPGKLVRMAPLMAGGRIMPGGNALRTVGTVATYQGVQAVTRTAGGAVRGGVGAATAGFKNGFSPPAQTSMSGAGFESSGWKGKIHDKAQEMGGKARNADAQEGQQPQSAKAAGGAAATPNTQGAAANAPQATPPMPVSSAGPGATAGIAAFESAPLAAKDANGGPAVMKNDAAREARVKQEHDRMNSMPPETRPDLNKTQEAWNTLGASPQAQKAVNAVSAATPDSTPKELANWSVEGNNPAWGPQAQDATRTIAEASPQVREHVVTDGQGYGNNTANIGGSGAAPKGGGGSTNNNGGTPTPTSRPANATKDVPDPVANHKRTAQRQGES